MDTTEVQAQTGNVEASGAQGGRNRAGRCRDRFNGRPALPATVVSLLDGPAVGETEKSLLDILTGSKLYREYERAFAEAVGVPLTLRAVETWQLPYHGKRGENRFCAILAAKSRSCAACLRTAQRLSRLACRQPATVTCASGLTETAVPVRIGDRLIGFLQTGQVFAKAPTEAQFERTSQLLSQWDVSVRKSHLREAYFETRTVTAVQQHALVTLLTIFAQHLSIIGDQLASWKVHAEPPAIARAKAYIIEHQNEELSLGQVAKAVNASSFTFASFSKSRPALTLSTTSPVCALIRPRTCYLIPTASLAKLPLRSASNRSLTSIEFLRR